METIDIYILDNKNLFIKSNNGETLEVITQEDKEKIYKEIANNKIKNKKYKEDLDNLLIEQQEQKVIIHKYQLQQQQPYFRALNRAINKYNKEQLKKKMTLIKASILTGIISISMGTLISNSINHNDNIELLDNEEEILILDSEEQELQEQKEQELVIDVNNNIIEQKNNIIEEIPKENKIEENTINQEINIDKTLTSYDQLKDISNYEDVIKLCANIFTIDYETAKNIVKQNINIINQEQKEINQWNSSELDRIKDLKSKSLINPDIMVTGIFISIKDYAYTNGITNETPIESNKTTKEKEQDIINVAKYIYGVEDEHLLADILAVHRLETGNGTSNLAINNNNLGGNRNADLTFVSYKTCEMGAESMVRNFLKNYNRAFYRQDYNINDSIEYNIAKSYCETPEEWAEVVTKNAKQILLNDELSNYLEENKMVL